MEVNQKLKGISLDKKRVNLYLEFLKSLPEIKKEMVKQFVEKIRITRKKQVAVQNLKKNLNSFHKNDVSKQNLVQKSQELSKDFEAEKNLLSNAEKEIPIILRHVQGLMNLFEENKVSQNSKDLLKQKPEQASRMLEELFKKAENVFVPGELWGMLDYAQNDLLKDVQVLERSFSNMHKEIKNEQKLLMDQRSLWSEAQQKIRSVLSSQDSNIKKEIREAKNVLATLEKSLKQEEKLLYHIFDKSNPANLSKIRKNIIKISERFWNIESVGALFAAFFAMVAGGAIDIMSSDPTPKDMIAENVYILVNCAMIISLTLYALLYLDIIRTDTSYSMLEKQVKALGIE